MPREIKFRGKKISDHASNGTWVYGAYLKVGGIENDKIVTKHVIATQEYPCKEIIFHVVEPESVGQCLYWEDSEGETIYEGDFLALDTDRYPEDDFCPCEIIFEDGAFRAKYADWAEDLSHLVITQNEIETMFYVIVGNKTENPELMEAVNAAE